LALTQAVDFGIIADAVDLRGVEVDTHAIAIESKLDDVAADTTECVQNINPLFISFIILPFVQLVGK